MEEYKEIDSNDFNNVVKQQKPLRYYGGVGFKNCEEIGNYEVRTELNTKSFKSLSEAKNYYDNVKGEKAIWDLKGETELIDAWYYR